MRVLPEGLVAMNKDVRMSNYCDVSAHMAHDGRTAVVVSAIDNMVKGAAGQAVQNMNIALGLDERAGYRCCPRLSNRVSKKATEPFSTLP